jgi:hypothetical protein
MRTLTNSNDLVALKQRLHTVQPGDRALWGIMSAAEMICHLRGAFHMAMGDIPSAPVAVPLPRAALKTIALWAPIPWPKNFETVPALKRGMPAMQVGLFAADKAETLAELDRFCRPTQVRVDHAFFGTMSFGDWMRWGFLHTDHHLRQFGH